MSILKQFEILNKTEILYMVEALQRRVSDMQDDIDKVETMISLIKSADEISSSLGIDSMFNLVSKNVETNETKPLDVAELEEIRIQIAAKRVILQDTILKLTPLVEVIS